MKRGRRYGCMHEEKRKEKKRSGIIRQRGGRGSRRIGEKNKLVDELEENDKEW